MQEQLRRRAAGAGGRLEKAIEPPQHIPRSAQEAGEELDNWMTNNVGGKFTAAYADNVPPAGVGDIDKFWGEVRKPLGKRIWIDALRSKANSRGQSPEQLEQNLEDSCNAHSGLQGNQTPNKPPKHLKTWLPRGA